MAMKREIKYIKDHISEINKIYGEHRRIVILNKIIIY